MSTNRRRGEEECKQKFFWLTIAKVCCFALKLDPFQMFKVEASRLAPRDAKIFPQLSIEQPKLDVWRKRYARVLAIVGSCILLRFFSTALIARQYLIYETTMSKGSESRQSGWIEFATIQRLCRAFSSPMIYAGDVLIFSYFLGPFQMSVLLFFIPYFYSKKLLNMAVLRYILKPNLEVKRVDLLIESQMQMIENSVHQFWRSISYFASNREGRQELEAIQRCESILRLLNKFRQEKHLFRPNIYSMAYQNKPVHLFIYPFTVVLVLIWCNSFVFLLVPFALKAKCNEFKLEKCTAFEILEPFEWLNIIELAIFLNSLALMYGIHQDLQFLLFSNQIQMIYTTRAQLDKQLNKLIESNNQLRKLQFSRRIDESNRYVVDSVKKDCDKSLLKTLIQVLVDQSELADNATSISETTMHLLFSVTGILLSMGLTSGLQRQRSAILRQFTYSSLFFATNLIATVCAHLFSQVVSLEKVFWSILCERKINCQLLNLLRRRNSLTSSTSSSEQTDCMTILWNKFAVSSSNYSSRFCVQPLRMQITYRRVIELNFFVVSIYTLTAGGSWCSSSLQAASRG